MESISFESPVELEQYLDQESAGLNSHFERVLRYTAGTRRAVDATKRGTDSLLKSLGRRVDDKHECDASKLGWIEVIVEPEQEKELNTAEVFAEWLQNGLDMLAKVKGQLATLTRVQEKGIAARGVMLSRESIPKRILLHVGSGKPVTPGLSHVLKIVRDGSR